MPVASPVPIRHVTTYLMLSPHFPMELILDEVSSTDMEFREILSILPLLLLSTSRLSFRPADGARVETGIEIKKRAPFSPGTLSCSFCQHMRRSEL